MTGSGSDDDARASRQYRRESRRMIQAALQTIPSLDARSVNEKVSRKGQCYPTRESYYPRLLTF